MDHPSTELGLARPEPRLAIALRLASSDLDAFSRALRGLSAMATVAYVQASQPSAAGALGEYGVLEPPDEVAELDWLMEIEDLLMPPLPVVKIEYFQIDGPKRVELRVRVEGPSADLVADVVWNYHWSRFGDGDHKAVSRSYWGRREVADYRPLLEGSRFDQMMQEADDAMAQITELDFIRDDGD